MMQRSSANASPAASEADLAAVWAGQLFRRGSLAAEDGSVLRVTYRGLAGAGPGPDFREAIIATADGVRHGDVELHVRAGDFRRHGHHRDAAYADVILHVVFEAEGEVWTALPGGGRAPVLVLPRPKGRRAWAPERAWAEPCATALGRVGPEAVAATLDRLGEMRFRQKAYAVRKRLAAGETPAEVAWAGLLEGLAYGGEREAFRSLAGVLPWAALARRLLPANEAARAVIAEEALAEAFVALPRAASRPARPGNGPERRLAGAAALAARFAVNGPAGALLPLVALPPKRAAQALVAALSVPRLVGRARAIELAANAMLPLAEAMGNEKWEMGPEESPFPNAHFPFQPEAQAEAIFAALPLPARYGAVRHLHRALAPVRLSARRQQGMLYLLKGYCTQGGCGKCALS